MKKSRRHSALTRRAFVRLAGLGAGTVVFGSWWLWPRGTGKAPTVPAFPRAASTGRVRQNTLEVAPAEITLGGTTVATWAYNAVLPGLQMRLTEGDTLRVTVKNRLPEAT